MPKDTENTSEIGYSGIRLRGLLARFLNRKREEPFSPDKLSRNEKYRHKIMRESSSDSSQDREQIDDFFHNEAIFLEEARAWLEPIAFLKRNGLTPSGRVQISDLMVLYHLLVDNKLEEIYEKFQEDETYPQEPASSQAIIERKVELALEFIKLVRRKNKEAQIFESQGNPNIQGIEIEYTDVLSREIWEYGYFKSYLLNRGIRIRPGTSINDIHDTLDSRVADPRVEMFLIQFQSLAKRFFGETIPTDEEEKAALLALQPADVIHTLQRLPNIPISYSTELRGGSEVQTLPSASYRTQLREVLYAYLAGGISADEKWNIHQTLGTVEQRSAMEYSIEDFPLIMRFMRFSNRAAYAIQAIQNKQVVDLTTDHTEVMDILLIAAAAGYVGRGTPKQIGTTITEYIPKPSFTDSGDFIYFPFHKRRTRFDSIQYKSEYAETQNAQSSDEKQEALIQAWKDLKRQWNTLLKTHQIQVLKQNEYFSRESMDAAIPYTKILSKIIWEYRHNKRFEAEAKALIREFNKRVAHILELPR